MQMSIYDRWDGQKKGTPELGGNPVSFATVGGRVSVTVCVMLQLILHCLHCCHPAERLSGSTNYGSSFCCCRSLCQVSGYWGCLHTYSIKQIITDIYISISVIICILYYIQLHNNMDFSNFIVNI